MAFVYSRAVDGETRAVLQELAVSLRVEARQLRLESVQMRARSRAILRACAERRSKAAAIEPIEPPIA